MKHLFAIETNSIKSVVEQLEAFEATSMIWMRLAHSGERAEVIFAAQEVLTLIHEESSPSPQPLEGCLLMTCTTNRNGDKSYRELGLVFSCGRSWHEPFDIIERLKTGESARIWAADIGIEQKFEFFNIDTYLDALREMHFESTHGPRKLYRQAKTIELFPFMGTTVELGALGEVAALFGASPLISGIKPISAI